MKYKYIIKYYGIELYPGCNTAEEVLVCIRTLIKSRWDIELNLDKIEVYYGNKILRMDRVIKNYIKKYYVQTMKYGRLRWIPKKLNSNKNRT